MHCSYVCVCDCEMWRDDVECCYQSCGETQAYVCVAKCVTLFSEARCVYVYICVCDSLCHAVCMHLIDKSHNSASRQ